MLCFLYPGENLDPGNSEKLWIPAASLEPAGTDQATRTNPRFCKDLDRLPVLDAIQQVT